MRLPEKCAACLYDHQAKKCSDEAFLTEVRNIIEERDEEDSTAVLVYRIKKVYERFYGKPEGYADIKRRYNDLVLQMESGIRKKIESSEDPLAAALAYARIGNYIDYGAMHDVEEATFLSLFDGAVLSEKDQATYESLLRNCEEADTFLLIADNCGEIVLDKLLLEQLKLRFPQLKLQVLVRGEDVLNDVTMEDAAYTGIDRIAQVLSNGKAVAGTVYEMMPQDAQKALDHADVILSKGQGNYESLSGLGRHIFYAFLCKCDYFTAKFQVLVRGEDVLNDVTMEDAAYTGIDRIAQVLSNGKAVAGTVYEMMPEDAQKALDHADVILSKGQGNYESLSGLGRHIFYAFLCKCDYFTAKFQVPLLTGMLVEETAS